MTETSQEVLDAISTITIDDKGAQRILDNPIDEEMSIVWDKLILRGWKGAQALFWKGQPLLYKYKYVGRLPEAMTELRRVMQ